MDSLLQDVRFAWRSLARTPTVTTAALLCLALGVGANTGVFSVVYGILLRPLPFNEADRLVTVHTRNTELGVEDGGIAWGDLEDLRAAGTFARVEALSDRTFTLTDGAEPELVLGAVVTPGLFEMLGVQPQIGRHFRADEAAPAGFEQAVMLSDALWRSRYQADPRILERTVHVNGRALPVAGVMPAGFAFPERERLWLPTAPATAGERGGRYLLAVARLQGGATAQAAGNRLGELATQLAAAYPASHVGWSFDVLPFRSAFIDTPARRVLVVMLGAVGFVLLIACANVANLLLARAADRQREVSVRAALGASRGRVLRLFLTESVLLAILAGALGVLIALWWVEATARAIPEELPYWISLEMDVPVLLYTLLLSVGTGIVFGMLPALQASRIDLHTSLKAGTRSSGDTRPRALLRGVLVTTEIALAVVLLAGATLMMQSFLRLQHASPGFDHEPLLSMRVLKSGDHYDDVVARTAFHRDVIDRVGALPNVIAAAATSAIPADDGGPTAALRTAPDAPPLVVTMYVSTEALFDVLGVRPLQGRTFTAHEATDTAARVAIIGAALAARLAPDGGAVGSVIRLGVAEADEWYEIVGVVPDLQYEEFGEESGATLLQVHLPYARRPYRQMALLVRTRTEPAALAAPVRAAIRTVDPLLAPFDVLTMTERRRYTTWPQRLFGQTFGVFGAAALLLALVGVYGVMAYTVSRRRREIGVRIAIGARPADVMRDVVARAARLGVTGVAIGVLAALALVRVLEGVLWGVTMTEPAAFLAVPALLLAAALLAAWLPARRAARVDPLEALRSD